MTLPAEAMAATMADEWARNGVVHAVLSPGSRSAPFALALHRHPEVSVHVLLDERSAGFFALGIAKATDRPALVLCTSGTAAANLAPAIHEARRQRVPLVVLTADRPPELRATGATQTIDQIKMFGDAVRWFCEVGVPEGQVEAAHEAYWRSVACRAVAEAAAGPVHLNAPLREPFVDPADAAPSPAGTGRHDGAPWTAVERAPRRPGRALCERLARSLDGRRGVVVAGASRRRTTALGDLASCLGWPLIAEPLSGVRGPGSIAGYDLFLRSEAFRTQHPPEVVVRVGATGTSKALLGYVEGAPVQILIDADGAWRDPRRSLTELVHADPDLAVEDIMACTPQPAEPGWLSSWLEAERITQGAIDRGLATERITEPGVARTVTAALPPGTNLVVGASMPIRDVEAFGVPRADMTYYANRGANGIDGFVSTALGIAAASDAPTYALCGDLTILHDSNGLLAADRATVTFVVVDNSGGGIFSFLPQAEVNEGFETLFATPQHRDLTALAGFHGLSSTAVATLDELRDELAGPARSSRLLLVTTDRADNVALHRRLCDEVADALAASAEQRDRGL